MSCLTSYSNLIVVTHEISLTDDYLSYVDYFKILRTTLLRIKGQICVCKKLKKYI